MPDTSARARRWAAVLLAAAAVLAGWAALIAVTGGFRIEIGPVRISSRNAVRAILLSLLPAAVAWRLAYREWLDVRLNRWRPVLHRVAAPVAWTMAAAVLATGVLYGVRAASAADTSGYVSQSALWVRGTLRIDQSFAGSLPWPHAPQTFAPLGYRIGAGGMTVPTYAPGLPLLMALGRTISACGPYLVGPICGALLVVFTFQLGRPLFGTGAALAASALVACSPLVIFMALTPMADVPAAAFWTGALAAALRPSLKGAVLSGLLTGIAILIRPNLVALAVFPWLLAMLRVKGIAPAAAGTMLFALGSVPGALFIAVFNTYLYGSPLESGYGDLAPGFSLAFAWTNVRQYSAWWWESQGPLAFLFVPALARVQVPAVRERLVLLAFGGSLGLLYLFYQPFSVWWFLRFLLPGIPIVFLFCADAIQWAARRSAAVKAVALTAFITIAGGHAIRFGDVHDVTDIGLGDQRYPEAAAYVAGTTPPDAVIVTMQHSGSLRYHAGRLTLRWDWMEPEWLDRAIAALQERGVPVYLLLERWEDPPFRARFEGQRTLAVLDEGPVAEGRDGYMRLYALDSLGHARRQPAAIPLLRDRTCRDIAPDYVEPPAVRTIRAGNARVP